MQLSGESSKSLNSKAANSIARDVSTEAGCCKHFYPMFFKSLLCSPLQNKCLRNNSTAEGQRPALEPCQQPSASPHQHCWQAKLLAEFLFICVYEDLAEEEKSNFLRMERVFSMAFVGNLS